MVENLKCICNWINVHICVHIGGLMDRIHLKLAEQSAVCIMNEQELIRSASQKKKKIEGEWDLLY